MSNTIIERLNSRIVDLEAKGECPLVVAELRDYKRHIAALEFGLAAAEQREAVLREAFNLLRRVALPPHDVSGRAMWDEALAKVGKLKGEGISMASDIGHTEGQM